MIDLYILQSCPYCKKVMKFFDENSIEYNQVDISDAANEESLVRMGGKRQVPFIVDRDRNVQMYESSDIIEYAKTIL